MDQSITNKSRSLAGDEKLTPVMVYTQNMLVRGNVITKESIRISIWLRTQGAPEFIHMLGVQAVIFGGNGPLQTHTFSELFLPTVQVLAFHMVPPGKDQVDYDESEKNRKMEPITFLVGTFRMNGLIRMSVNTDLSTHFSVAKSTFISIYEIDVSNPFLAAMGTMHVPMALIRPAMVSFGVNKA